MKVRLVDPSETSHRKDGGFWGKLMYTARRKVKIEIPVTSTRLTEWGFLNVLSQDDFFS